MTFVTSSMVPSRTARGSANRMPRVTFRGTSSHDFAGRGWYTPTTYTKYWNQYLFLSQTTALPSYQMELVYSYYNRPSLVLLTTSELLSTVNS